ncbi:MAG: signal recognition particle protein [Xanthomonadales bacterium]|nr:signal recognition particle protein [Xanthomonadales bacterium]
MFGQLTQRLSETLGRIRGRGRLTEDNIRGALREVRMALLEADVALPVVKQFISQVKRKAVGLEVNSGLQPGQAFVKLVHDELVELLGGTTAPLDLKAARPVVVLMAGLQGSGKTTSSGKLARFLIEKQNQKVGVVSADVYRPAAIEQLRLLAEQVGAEWIASDVNQKPADIATNAHAEARRLGLDVLIVDTAGRLHIDDAMMGEIKTVHAAVKPHETLFVVDAMTGQDAANTAKAFHEALPLSGIVLTKTDGDARGGAALSVRKITGCPVKFLGVGEKTEALEIFHPDRLASRILGMGDVLSLVEEVQSKVDKKEAEKLANKLAKGKGFDLEDLRSQMLQMENMGGMESMLGKLPGVGALPPDALKNQNISKETGRMVAIINSMTPKERRNPDVIRGSRKKRIAMGSGTQVQDVNRLLKQYQQMAKMMKKMRGGGMARMMRQLKNKMPGGFPPGGMPPGGQM